LLRNGLTLQTQTVKGKTVSGIFFEPTKKQKNKRMNSLATSNNQLKTKSLNTTENVNKKKVTKKRIKPDTNLIQNKKDILKENSFKLKNKNEASVNNSNNSNNKTISRKSSTSIPNRNIFDPNYVTLTKDQLNTILSLVKTQHDIDVSKAINTNTESKHCQENASSSSKSIKMSQDSNSTQKALESESIGSIENSSQIDLKSLAELETVTTSTLDKPQQSDFSLEEVKQVENNKTFSFASPLMGLGSREQEKEKLEQDKRKWVNDLKAQVKTKKEIKIKENDETKLKKKEIDFGNENKCKKPSIVNKNIISNSNKSKLSESTLQDNEQTSKEKERLLKLQQREENLPSAIRSSFLIGEPAPRNHAFSAKKLQEQKRWKEELEKQIYEQKMKKSKMQVQSTISNSIEDEDLWFKHFDTIQHKNRENYSTVVQKDFSLDEGLLSAKSNSEIKKKTIQNKSSPEALPSHSIDPLRTKNSLNDDTPEVNHLRKMTSLLDPAQKDAMRMKRIKQQEHRRAIAEQVAERKRMKEEEERIRRLEDEEADRKLREEVDSMQSQFEKEKLTQLQKEEVRDQKTRQLYQQMQEAQASALKEKFEKRQKLLRKNGHDTSRLEQHHKIELIKAKSNEEILKSNIPSINLHGINSPTPQIMSLSRGPGEQFENSIYKNQYQASINQPVRLEKVGDDNPIRLEISVTKSNSFNNTKEISIQTDQVKNTDKNGLNTSFISVSPTEYIPLPISSSRKKRSKNDQSSSHQKGDDKMASALKKRNELKTSPSNLYDKYAKQNKINKSQKGPKPKWGVGDKSKKKFVPASSKYTAGGSEERKRREEAKQRRINELRKQQQANEKLFLRTEGAEINRVNRKVTETKRNSKINDECTKITETRRNNKINDDTKKGINKRYEEKNFKKEILINEHDAEGQSHNKMTLENIDIDKRPMSVTTLDAKYQANRHTAGSPVPGNLADFVEYRRSDAVLDPNAPQSRPDTGYNNYASELNAVNESPLPNTVVRKNTNIDITVDSARLKNKERQDQILKEISILRKGLLLKQREIASYPVAIPPKNKQLSLNKNNN